MRGCGAGEGIAIQQLDLTSEVGSISLVGAVTPDEADRWSNGVAAAPRDLRAAARLDLQRLAAVAPQLVRLQQGARVDSGRVEVTAVSKEGRVTARLATGALAGVAGGRRVEWREPLDVQVAARQEVPTAGTAGWVLFSVIWSMALTGIVLKLFFTGRYKLFSTLMYVFMGWLIVFFIQPLAAALPPAGLGWLLAGGIAYTLGAVLYSIHRIPYSHACFHVLVVVGSACHFWAIYRYVLPAT